MAPTMLVSAPLAGGSKSAIARCVGTKCPRMRYASVACSPGVATSSMRRMEPTCQHSCSKEKLPEFLTACSVLTSRYQVSNDHARDRSREACLLERASPRYMRLPFCAHQQARLVTYTLQGQSQSFLARLREHRTHPQPHTLP